MTPTPEPRHPHGSKGARGHRGPRDLSGPGGGDAAERRRSARLSEPQSEGLARAKRAARWVGLIIPLGLLTAGLVLLLVWMPRMPDPAATHWGFTGGPDGFGSPWTYVWLLLGVGFGMVLMMRAMASLGGLDEKQPIWSWMQRFMAAFAAGFAVFTLLTNVGSVAIQLDLDDASDAPGVGPLAGIAFGAWVVVSVLAWFVQPNFTLERPWGEASAPLPDGQSIAWSGEVRPSKTFLWVTAGAILVVLASVVFMFLLPTDAVSRTITVVAALLVLVLGVTSTWFRVRIDRNGLEARSVLGWPVFRLPSNEVERVEVARIEPFAEFGGWGLRWAPGRFGIVMRTGEGIIATRRDGRIFALTLDEAQAAAAALAAAADRARETDR